MPQRAAAALSTVPQPRSGTRICAPGVRRPRSSPPTKICGDMCRTGSRARSSGRTGALSPVRMCGGAAGVMAAARIAAGRGRGVRSRSLTASSSISLMMSRCGSRTRRSTRRCVQGRGALRRELTACLRIDTELAVYCCDPHSPWQRGTNENTNGLFRQYFPKGTDLTPYTADNLAAVAATLTGRPRKTLGWKTPADALAEHLHSCQQCSVATTGSFRPVHLKRVRSTSPT